MVPGRRAAQALLTAHVFTGVLTGGGGETKKKIPLRKYFKILKAK